MSCRFYIQRKNNSPKSSEWPISRFILFFLSISSAFLWMLPISFIAFNWNAVLLPGPTTTLLDKSIEAAVTQNTSQYTRCSKSFLWTSALGKKHKKQDIKPYESTKELNKSYGTELFRPEDGYLSSFQEISKIRSFAESNTAINSMFATGVKAEVFICRYLPSN